MKEIVLRCAYLVLKQAMDAGEQGMSFEELYKRVMRFGYPETIQLVNPVEIFSEAKTVIMDVFKKIEDELAEDLSIETIAQYNFRTLEYAPEIAYKVSWLENLFFKELLALHD